MYEGSCVALITPFRNGEIDYACVERLVALHIENGTAGLVPCGTTGESPTLSPCEHMDFVEFIVKCAAGRLPVIAGTGANSTREAIELTVAAAKAGADATLQVSPYYNKPEPEGMYRHFRAIAEASKLPMILYSIPGRTGRAIALETIYRLAEDVKEVVAVKAAGGSTDRVAEIRLNTDLDILSGDDAMTLPMMSVGATGVISVAANFIPKDVADMVSAALQADFAAAREMHLKMYPIFKAIFVETNPIPVKAAMEMMGLCDGEMRLPLSPIQPENRAKLESALRDYGLLS